MPHQRAHVIIPTSLVEEIDEVVGPRKRSEFIVSATERELRRLKQLSAIQKYAGSWGKQHHPELEKAGSSAAFVKKLRKEWNKRTPS